MDLCVRYWCVNTNTVATRYVTSVFLGRQTADNLVDSFLEGLADLDRKRLLQVSMDGPNVNISFLKKLKNVLSSEETKSPLLDIGVCGLHTVNGAFKTGHQKVDWKTFEVLKTMYNLFKDSPARRALYTQITEGTLFPQKFTSIR